MSSKPVSQYFAHLNANINFILSVLANGMSLAIKYVHTVGIKLNLKIIIKILIGMAIIMWMIIMTIY